MPESAIIKTPIGFDVSADLLSRSHRFLMSPESSSSSSKKKRRNLEMRVVENAKRRRVTFAKRRQGLFSKAEELGAVCSVDVAVVAFTSCGKAFSFGDDAIRRYLRLAREHDGNQDGREECGSVKATGMEDPV
ncbi:agamous-like MADS-box protein AGL29 [Musa acuminata AAA Group]|uniref:agamous-like MADS-box protein AGL29 n=1 Tax=Musa acuminata AAA Group TaxID=214697 RepID=UPI0031D73840